MNALFKSALIVTLVLSVGCSTKSEDPDEQAGGEDMPPEAAQEAALGESGPDEAPADLAAGEAANEMAGEAADEAAEDGEPEEIPTELEGAEWTVEQIGGDDVVEGTQPLLAFGQDGEEITGQASCNRFFGTYETSGDTLTIATEGLTRMACAEHILDQEKLFLETLKEVDGYQIDDEGVLTLSAEGEEVVSARP